MRSSRRNNFLVFVPPFFPKGVPHGIGNLHGTLQWMLLLQTQIQRNIPGIIVSGLMFWLQAWVIEKKGVIFNAVFGPLTLIIAAIYSAIFVQETLHSGSFLGCGLVVSGLYIFLWVSNQEAEIKAQEQSCHSIEGTDMEGKASRQTNQTN